MKSDKKEDRTNKMIKSILFCLQLTQYVTANKEKNFVRGPNHLKSAWPQDEIVFGLNLPWVFGEEKIGKIGKSGFNYPQYFASAADVAVEDINNNRRLLPKNKLKYLWRERITDTQCDEMQAIRGQIEQIRMGVHAFIGFVCNFESVTKNAAAINLPMISMDYNAMTKEESATLATVSPLGTGVVSMIISLLRKFHWKKIAVVYEENKIWEPVYKTLKRQISDSDEFKITLKTKYDIRDTYRYKDENLDHIFMPFLKELPSKARVVLLLCEKGYLRQFMLHVAKQGLDNGDYVYIAIHPFVSSPSLLRNVKISKLVWSLPWRGTSQNGGPSEKLLLAQAYQSLFVIQPQIHWLTKEQEKKYNRFKQQVKDRMSKPPFQNNLYLGLSKRVKPPVQAERLYNAIMMYALAMNKTIENYDSITNGTAIIENMKGMKFTGIDGSPLFVNPDGELQPPYNVLQFQFKKKSMKNLAEKKNINNFSFSPTPIYKMTPICHGVSCSSVTYKMESIKGARERWQLGSLPLDTPKCGFFNKKC
ncbi:receptor-type guanylate cyclase gcy-22-like [Hydractinia symbiolongicarpus]|uniref:receptor-type guanylate cyclase gcy-22-like n=1 Tax=Hydractinia symbiolongicarpus TaxID=13093 RepID=UPI00254AC009|nr:receptor-type guanylate cyclase gcy-22-like [Hydractinia symbiolongicarpus]